MKETNEMKAKYFAQYWGQRIARYKTDKSIKLRIGHPCVDINDIDSIELKPLEAIADEDAKALHSILRLGYNEAGFETKWQDIKKAVIEDGFEGLMLFDFYGRIIECYHYLQSNGFALDWNGYSVKDLIAAGCLQLTPNKG